MIFLSYGMKQLIHVVRGALRKKPTNIIHLKYGSERNSWFYFPLLSFLDHTFEFYQGHVTKNQPITVLVLLSESLGL